MRSLALLALASTPLALGACAGEPRVAAAPATDGAPVIYRLEEVPAPLAPAVARAEAAVKALRERVAARRAAVVAAAGPVSAMEVCRVEAPALAAEVAAQTGVGVGRTWARRPDSGRGWAVPLVRASAGRRAGEIAPAVVDLGDRVGLLRPIAIVDACLACHGGAERLAPEIRAALGGSGQGGAIGLSEGDLAGFYWAEARK